MSKPSKAVLRLSLNKRAEIAFKIAVAKAIDEHARLGLPIFVWRDGKVVAMSAEGARRESKSARKKQLRRPSRA